MNLATNARDAMPQGGSIVISTEVITLNSDFVTARGFGEPGRYALLTFTDSGDGMEADIAKHIFEPFYTTKELGKGTGLGLSIVYGIIKKHNGYISCHSTIGLGTIFQIYLPLVDSVPAVTEKKVQEKVEDVQGEALSCSLKTMTRLAYWAGKYWKNLVILSLKRLMARMPWKSSANRTGGSAWWSLMS